MNKEDIVEKTEVLISSWEKVRERDKTPGTDMEHWLKEATSSWRHSLSESEKLDMIKEMYVDSDLMTVASATALELLWHWINEIRFDGKHAEDLMLIARGARTTPGQHQLHCLLMTEQSSGIDVMAGAIRHELGKLWSIAADNVHISSMEDKIEELEKKTITITKARYAELDRAEDVLLALQNAGVDSWDGWDDVMQQLEEGNE